MKHNWSSWGQAICAVIAMVALGGCIYGFFTLNSYIRETFNVGFILADVILGSLFLGSLIAITLLVLLFVYLKNKIHKHIKKDE